MLLSLNAAKIKKVTLLMYSFTQPLMIDGATNIYLSTCSPGEQILMLVLSHQQLLLYNISLSKWLNQNHKVIWWNWSMKMYWEEWTKMIHLETKYKNQYVTMLVCAINQLMKYAINWWDKTYVCQATSLCRSISKN